MLSAAYFSVETVATVGYGDYSFAAQESGSGCRHRPHRLGGDAGLYQFRAFTTFWSVDALSSLSVVDVYPEWSDTWSSSDSVGSASESSRACSPQGGGWSWWRRTTRTAISGAPGRWASRSLSRARHDVDPHHCQPG